MDTIFIKDLQPRGIIGINDWERQKPQQMLINITLFADLKRAGASDNVLDSVNYRSIAKKVMQHAETAQRFTVEALATDCARICLDEPLVSKVIIRVEKPAAVRFSESVGVEIERSKGEL